MVPNEDREKFLETLETLPIVSVACKRVGINKATIYRWLKDDATFKDRYDDSLRRGRETLVDHAESKLLKLIEKENLGAIRYFLDSNDKRYHKPRKPILAPPVTPAIRTIRYEIVDGRQKPTEPPASDPTPPPT